MKNILSATDDLTTDEFTTDDLTGNEFTAEYIASKLAGGAALRRRV